MTVREIGQLIKERRKVYNLSTIELADNAGVSLTLLKQVESGNRNPTLDSLNAILDVIGLELNISEK